MEDATVETPAKFEPGTELGIQKTDYRFVMIDEQWIWRSLAIVCVAVCAVVAGLFCLLTGFGGRRGPGFREAWRRVPGEWWSVTSWSGSAGWPLSVPEPRCWWTGSSDEVCDRSPRAAGLARGAAPGAGGGDQPP